MYYIYIFFFFTCWKVERYIIHSNQLDVIAWRTLQYYEPLYIILEDWQASTKAEHNYMHAQVLKRKITPIPKIIEI